MTDDIQVVEKPFKIIVMTATFPGYYGRADSIPKARSNCLSETGRSKEYRDKLVAWLVHEDTSVTGLGGFQWPKDQPAPIRLGKV